MKAIIMCLMLAFAGAAGHAQQTAVDTASLRQSLEKATAAIRAAFEKGEARKEDPDIYSNFEYLYHQLPKPAK